VIGIIGATGFIGRSLADDCRARGRPYRAFVRSLNSVPADAFVGADAIVTFDLNATVDPAHFADVHTVILLASATKHNVSFNSYAYESMSNIAPHCHFLTQLIDTDVRHVVFVSSGGTVYGRNDARIPTPETAALKPCTPYGFGKVCIETAVETIWGGAGRLWTVLRPSNPVGRHQRMSVGAHGLVTTLFHRLREDLPITVFGDGSTVRDYFAVEDLTDLVLRAVDHPRAASLILNASSGRGETILNIVAACERGVGRPARLTFQPDKRPDIAYSVLDNSRALETLGWRPTRSLDDIIRGLG
jgi:UDP-glucose 4-epimerase